MGGKHSRDKGKRGERAIANRFKELGFDKAHRGWQSRAGTDACDVEGTPYWVEVKFHKKVNYRAALRQAVEDSTAAGDPRPPLVVAKDDHEEAVVFLRWADFQMLLVQLRGEDDVRRVQEEEELP